MKRLFFVLLLISFVFAQPYYQVYLVRANDSNITNMLYDDNSTSYTDNSIENPDASLRICALEEEDLLDKYISIVYAASTDKEQLEIVHAPVQITDVSPTLCAEVPIDFSSFKTWYPSVPYVVVSDDRDLTTYTRWKLSRRRGWFVGDYGIIATQNLTHVNVNVTNATDDLNNTIIPDVDFLVIGLMKEDGTATDTEISSINDSVDLSLDGFTGAFSIIINGLPDRDVLPPYVEIFTPEDGSTYETTNIPFNFLIVDDEGVQLCWYVLDGRTTPLPDCDVSYILQVEGGTHTLTLFASDFDGNIGSDRVSFTVLVPSGPTGGGRYGGFPPIPPSPPRRFITIIPENIFIILEYPNPGEEGFIIQSTSVNATNLTCFVESDFSEYTTVVLDSTEIMENNTIEGNIIVDMPPKVALDYSGTGEGLLQCVGNDINNTDLIYSASANVYLSILKPELVVLDDSVEGYIGEESFGTITVRNIGSADAINVSAESTGPYSPIASVEEVPITIPAGESAEIKYRLTLPSDLYPDDYKVEIAVYEHGRQMDKGVLTVNAVTRPFEKPEEKDLLWTLLILLIGLLIAIWVFIKKIKKNKKFFWEKYGDSIKYSGAVLIITVIVWFIVFTALGG